MQGSQKAQSDLKACIVELLQNKVNNLQVIVIKYFQFLLKRERLEIRAIGWHQVTATFVETVHTFEFIPVMV